MLNKLSFSKTAPFMRYAEKILYSQTDHRRQYGACAWHAGHQRLQTHTQNKYLLLFPLQQWFNERASVLRYTYIARLSLI